MKCKKQHFHYFLFIFLRKGNIATETHKEICDVYSVNCIIERMYHNWFNKIKVKIEENRYITNCLQSG